MGFVVVSETSITGLIVLTIPLANGRGCLFCAEVAVQNEKIKVNAINVQKWRDDITTLCVLENNWKICL